MKLLFIRLNIVLLFFVIEQKVYSQSTNQGVVFYHFIKKNLGIDETYFLKFKNNESVYIHHQEEKKFKSPQGYDITLQENVYDWYLDAKTKKSIEQRKNKKNDLFYAKSDAEEINWELQNETKKILGYTVQKATADKHHYRTSDEFDSGKAIAWFAKDIPISSGPEKFWGLPGLIVELEFEKSTYKCTTEKITFEPQKIEKPTEGIEVTKQQLEKPEKIDKKLLRKANNLLNDN